MHSIVSVLALAAVAYAAPQAGASGDCQSTVEGSFTLTTPKIPSSPSKRDLETRQDSSLVVTLQNGVLKDSQGRTGSIVANHQFQFDNPVQPDALKTSGWCLYSNGTLAVDGNVVFYSCLSGKSDAPNSETFGNLYDEDAAANCTAVYLYKGSSGSASQSPDGQPVATQITDGQAQGTAGPTISQPMPITQISDGQAQGTAGPTISQPTPGPAPITQISDGQAQGTAGPAIYSGTPVTQISDGQVQATAGPAPAAYTGAAARDGVAGGLAVVAGIAGAVLLL